MMTKRIERVEFSLLKASEGGISRDAACAMLRDAGVVGVQYAHSPYVGHYGTPARGRCKPVLARLQPVRTS